MAISTYSPHEGDKVRVGTSCSQEEDTLGTSWEVEGIHTYNYHDVEMFSEDFSLLSRPHAYQYLAFLLPVEICQETLLRSWVVSYDFSRLSFSFCS